jgi:hypothetical protein
MLWIENAHAFTRSCAGSAISGEFKLNSLYLINSIPISSNSFEISSVCSTTCKNFRPRHLNSPPPADSRVVLNALRAARLDLADSRSRWCRNQSKRDSPHRRQAVPGQQLFNLFAPFTAILVRRAEPQGIKAVRTLEESSSNTVMHRAAAGHLRGTRKAMCWAAGSRGSLK